MTEKRRPNQETADATFARIRAMAQGAGISDRTHSRSARKWFRDLASQVVSVRSVKAWQKDKGGDRTISAVNQETIGHMIMFFYDAKTKDKLPYWDKFPLVFPLEIYSNGFLGLNFHYLSPVLRAKLMDQLYTLSNKYIAKKKYDNTTYLKISYAVLNNAARFKLFRPCIKRYLSSHIRSGITVVKPTEWDATIMLPTARFQKRSNEYVWQQSSRGFTQSTNLGQ